MFLLAVCSSRSFGMMISVSTMGLSCSMPCSAILRRWLPSKVNGRVTTPTVSKPRSWAMLAMIGERRCRCRRPCRR